jgi:hypothetical protein
VGHVSTSNCGADDLHVHLRRLVGVKGRILCKSEKHARLASLHLLFRVMVQRRVLKLRLMCVETCIDVACNVTVTLYTISAGVA